MLFVAVIEPIFEEIGTVIVTALEVIRGKLTVKITEYSNSIIELENKSSTGKKIGFAIPKEKTKSKETKELE